MVHQGGHSQLFRFSADGVVGVGHIGPIVSCGLEVGCQFAIGSMGVGMRSNAMFRIVPIFHYLSHGGSDTSSHRTSRTQHVVRIALTPLGLNQRSHFGGRPTRAGVALDQVAPLLCHFGRGSHLMRYGILYLITVPLDPNPLVVGHVFDVEATRQRVAKDGLHTVVGSHQDKAVLRGEHIHIGETGSRCDIFQSSCLCAVVVQESGCSLARPSPVDSFSHRHRCNKHQQHH